MNADSGFWWISFCDPCLAEGKQFLGACIVPGIDILTAAIEASTRGCNPGGECAGFAIPQLFVARLAEYPIAKLMNRDECERIDALFQDKGEPR